MSFRRGLARFEQLFATELKFNVLSQTLTGHTTIQAGGPSVMALDPGGAARNVLMPPEEDCEGKVYILINKADAAETITWQNDAGGTIGSIAQNETGLAIVVGGVWCLIGVAVA